MFDQFDRFQCVARLFGGIDARRSIVIGFEYLQVRILGKQFVTMQRSHRIDLMKHWEMRAIDFITPINVANYQEIIQPGTQCIHLMGRRMTAQQVRFV